MAECRNKYGCCFCFSSLRQGETVSSCRVPVGRASLLVFLLSLGGDLVRVEICCFSITVHFVMLPYLLLQLSRLEHLPRQSAGAANPGGTR